MMVVMVKRPAHEDLDKLFLFLGKLPAGVKQTMCQQFVAEQYQAADGMRQRHQSCEPFLIRTLKGEGHLYNSFFLCVLIRT